MRDVATGPRATKHSLATCRIITSVLTSAPHYIIAVIHTHNIICRLCVSVIDFDCNLSREQSRYLYLCEDSSFLRTLNEQICVIYDTITMDKAVCKNIAITVHLGKVSSTDAAVEQDI